MTEGALLFWIRFSVKFYIYIVTFETKLRKIQVVLIEEQIESSKKIYNIWTFEADNSRNSINWSLIYIKSKSELKFMTQEENSQEDTDQSTK